MILQRLKRAQLINSQTCGANFTTVSKHYLLPKYIQLVLMYYFTLLSTALRSILPILVVGITPYYDDTIIARDKNLKKVR